MSKREEDTIQGGEKLKKKCTSQSSSPQLMKADDGRGNGPSSSAREVTPEFYGIHIYSGAETNKASGFQRQFRMKRLMRYVVLEIKVFGSSSTVKLLSKEPFIHHGLYTRHTFNFKLRKFTKYLEVIHLIQM